MPDPDGALQRRAGVPRSQAAIRLPHNDAIRPPPPPRSSTGSPRAPPACCCTRRACPATLASARSTTISTGSSNFWRPPAASTGSSARSDRRATAIRPTSASPRSPAIPISINLLELTRHGLLPQDALGPLVFLNADRVDYGALYRLVWPLLDRACENFRAGRGPAPYGDFAAFQEANAAWLEPYAFFRALKDHYEGRPWWEWPAEARICARAQKSKLRGQLGAADRGARVLPVSLLRPVAPRAGRRREARRGASSATSRSSWRWTAPTRGPPRTSSSSTSRPAGRSPSPACRPTIFPPTASSGAIRSTAGTCTRPTATRGGTPACAPRSSSTTSCASTTSAVSPTTGAFRFPPPPPARASGGPVRAWRFSSRSGAPIPARRSSPRTSANSPRPRGSCGATPACPAWPSCSSPSAARARTCTSRTTSRPTASSIPARTTTTPASAGTRPTDEKTRDHVRRYLRVSGAEIGWDFIRAAYAAVSRLAVITLQDLLSLGSEARFNIPGRPDGNWQWRYRPAAARPALRRHDRLSARARGSARPAAGFRGRGQAGLSGGPRRADSPAPSRRRRSAEHGDDLGTVLELFDGHQVAGDGLAVDGERLDAPADARRILHLDVHGPAAEDGGAW